MSVPRTRPTRESEGFDLGPWVLRVGLAGCFVMVGLAKFPGDPTGQWFRIFEQIGAGQWFRYATGCVEVGAGLLYLIPRATLVAAAVMGCTMLGAIGVHIFVLHHPQNIIFPGAILAAVVAVTLTLRDR